MPGMPLDVVLDVVFIPVEFIPVELVVVVPDESVVSEEEPAAMAVRSVGDGALVVDESLDALVVVIGMLPDEPPFIG